MCDFYYAETGMCIKEVELSRANLLCTEQLCKMWDSFKQLTGSYSATVQAGAEHYMNSKVRSAVSFVWAK